MFSRFRSVLAIAGALAMSAPAAAQDDARLTAIIMNWVQQEATAFPGLIRQYIGRCLTNAVLALPDEAQQIILDTGDVPAARPLLTANAPEARAAFQDGVANCSRTAEYFGNYVLDWVFATQLPDAEGEVLLEASFCILDALMPLDDTAKQYVFLGTDQRGADFYRDVLPILAAALPETAAEVTAATDACLTL